MNVCYDINVVVEQCLSATKATSMSTLNVKPSYILVISIHPT
jgi:hypothetical protein